MGEVFVIRHYSIALVFMTPVALMMTEFVAVNPAHGLVTDRAVETIIRAACAFAVILLTTRRQRRKSVSPSDRQPRAVLSSAGHSAA